MAADAMGPGDWGEMLRHGLPPLLAVAVAFWVDARARRRRPGLPVPLGLDHAPRRVVAVTLLALALWLAVLAALGQGEPPTPEQVASLGLFEILLAPAILLAAALGWSWLAHGGALAPGRRALEALGLLARRPAKELAIGLVVGVGAWAAVLAVAIVAAASLSLLGGAELLGDEPSSLVVGMAGLPIAWRLALSIAAGVGEEIFFRGLLQPRIGIAASTLLFAVGHVGYGQPFLLLGVTLLSLIYGLLAAWRGNVWAAVVAHALFDAIQLLLLIPLALEGLTDSSVVAFLLAAGFC